MTALVSLDSLITEIKIYEKNALSSYWEIGKRLTYAKGLVNHGEWEDWLDKNLGYSRSMASKLIKVFDSYSNVESIQHFNFSQALALTSLEENDRKDFIKNNDVESMTVRELKEKIKLKEEEIRIQKKINIDLKNKNIEITEANKILSEEINSKETVKEIVEVIPEDYEEIKSSLKQQEEINQKLNSKLRLQRLDENKEKEMIKSTLSRIKWHIKEFLEIDNSIIAFLPHIEDLDRLEQETLAKSSKNLLEFAYELYDKTKKYIGE